MYDELDVTLEDVLTQEELEALAEEMREDEYCAPLNNYSLGISDKDFM